MLSYHVDLVANIQTFIDVVGVTQSPHLLTVKIHKLKNLANVDKFSLTESFRHALTKKEELDPFVYVEYAGVRIRTDEVYAGRNCEVLFIHIIM